MKKNNEQLINNIIGQLEGLKKMLQDKKDCFDVIIQMKAAKSSFEKVMSSFVEDNFVECASKVNKKDKEKLQKLLREIIKK